MFYVSSENTFRYYFETFLFHSLWFIHQGVCTLFGLFLPGFLVPLIAVYPFECKLQPCAFIQSDDKLDTEFGRFMYTAYRFFPSSVFFRCFSLREVSFWMWAASRNPPPLALCVRSFATWTIAAQMFYPLSPSDFL